MRTSAQGKVHPSKELAVQIIDQLSDGNGSFRKLCELSNVHPGPMIRFICADPQLEEQYARAKEIQMEALSEEITEISDERPVETIVTESATITKVDNAGIQRNRLRVDTRKWLMSKLAPKKYGDKVAVDHSGSVDLGLAERLREAQKRLDEGQK